MFGITNLLTRFAEACNPGAGGNILSFPTWYKYLGGEVRAGKCTPVLNLTQNPQNVSKIVLALIEIALRIGGLVAVGFVIYGGFQFILSQGEPDKAASARRTIINALIGLIIAIMATVIVSFIAGSLT
jgi:hypothetical protein